MITVKIGKIGAVAVGTAYAFAIVMRGCANELVVLASSIVFLRPVQQTWRSWCLSAKAYPPGARSTN